MKKKELGKNACAPERDGFAHQNDAVALKMNYLCRKSTVSVDTSISSLCPKLQTYALFESRIDSRAASKE